MTNSPNFELTDSQIQSFIDDGFVKISGAFTYDTAKQSRELLWEMIEAEHPDIDRNDSSTWPTTSETEPLNVIRIEGSDDSIFVDAANTPKLTSAFDQLVGERRWIPRYNMGSFVIPFPSDFDDGDMDHAHIDGCELINGRYQLRFETDCRVLLMLFLYDDVTEINAPTQLWVGSHKLVAPVLFANKGNFMRSEDVTEQIPFKDLPVAFATGNAGDVYLCHPFTVHTGTFNRSNAPRFLAQPGLEPVEPLNVERDVGFNYSPVEIAVREAIGLS